MHLINILTDVALMLSMYTYYYFYISSRIYSSHHTHLMSYAGGAHGRQHPTPFLCLLLKLLQIQPSDDILHAYLHQSEWKYLKALAAMYVRLTFPSHKVYTTLEPLLSDYRKLRRRKLGN